jgi:hypothetical protein
MESSVDKYWKQIESDFYRLFLSRLVDVNSILITNEKKLRPAIVKADYAKITSILGMQFRL